MNDKLTIDLQGVIACPRQAGDERGTNDEAISYRQRSTELTPKSKADGKG